MWGQEYLKDVVTLKYDVDQCVGCGICGVVCPQRVFAVEDKKAFIIDRDLCMECGACASNCPANAIIVKPGVGCAYGIIMGYLLNTEPTCGCSSEDGGSKSSCC